MNLFWVLHSTLTAFWSTGRTRSLPRALLTQRATSERRRWRRTRYNMDSTCKSICNRPCKWPIVCVISGTGNCPFYAKAGNQVQAPLSRARRTVVLARAQGDDESPRQTSCKRPTGNGARWRFATISGLCRHFCPLVWCTVSSPRRLQCFRGNFIMSVSITDLQTRWHQSAIRLSSDLFILIYDRPRGGICCAANRCSNAHWGGADKTMTVSWQIKAIFLKISTKSNCRCFHLIAWPTKALIFLKFLPIR